MSIEYKYILKNYILKMVTGPKQILHKGFDAFEFVCCGMKT